MKHVLFANREYAKRFPWQCFHGVGLGPDTVGQAFTYGAKGGEVHIRSKSAAS